MTTAPDTAAPVAVEVIAAAEPAVPPAPIPFVRPEDRVRDLEAVVEGAIATLASQLAQGHTAAYLEVLAFYSRFHRYSVPNTILIRAQRPNARLVAGMKRWNQLGYRVRAGEKAVWVWAPTVRKVIDEGTGELVERVVGFRPAPIFADSQILIPEDQPLPSLFRPLPDDCDNLYQAAKGRVIASGIAVEEVALPGGIQGASLGGRIVITAGLDRRSRLLVLAHELAHELAHQGVEGDEKSRQIRGLGAESRAYVVGQVLGVTSPFSADYLINYGLDAAALQAALGTIQRLVRRVMAIVAPDQVRVEGVRRAA